MRNVFKILLFPAALIYLFLMCCIFTLMYCGTWIYDIDAFRRIDFRKTIADEWVWILPFRK